MVGLPLSRVIGRPVLVGRLVCLSARKSVGLLVAWLLMPLGLPGGCLVARLGSWLACQNRNRLADHMASCQLINRRRLFLDTLLIVLHKNQQ